MVRLFDQDGQVACYRRNCNGCCCIATPIAANQAVPLPQRLTFTGRSAELRHMADTFSNVSVMRSNAFAFLLALCVAAAPVTAAGPNRVKDLVDAGEILPFETIKNSVAAQTRGDYVGVELDESSLRYRFRFLVDGNVVNVDVDARTGKILNARKRY